MRELQTEIEISAPISKVWSILTDFDNWKDWNPISQASGAASLGSKLTITMCADKGKKPMKYMPVVTSFDAPKHFRWRGKMMAGFLMTNDKEFELQEIDSGTRLIHKELFSGLLVPMFWGKLNSGVVPMLTAMNEALKKRVESSQS